MLTLKALAARAAACLAVLCTPSVLASLPALPIINTNNVFNVLNPPYNALPDGLTTNTAALQQAINDASSAPGGGTVELPGPGTFLSGPLTFKSRVNLQIDSGATLRFLPSPGYANTTSPLGATNLTDLEISGSGTIDGQGATWWSQSTRPVMIFFTRCVRVLLQDVRLVNPPKMHIAFKNAAGEITIQRLTIVAPDNSPNTDGIDLIGTNCLVQNCFISTGDDNIAVGSSASGAFAANILITNCVFGFGHGVSIGSNTQGGVSNMTVIDCLFTNTDNGIRMKSDNLSSGGSGQGGIAQNLNYFNIRMTNVAVPIFVYSYYTSFGSPSSSITPAFAANQPVPSPIPSTTAVWRNILISNLTSTFTSGSSKAMIWGKTELWVTNFVLMNSRLDVSAPFRVFNAQGVRIVDSQVTAPAGNTTFTVFNADLALSNTVASSKVIGLDGLAGTNALTLFNASATTSDSGALGANPITLASGSLAVSNNLTLPANSVLNMGEGTTPCEVSVSGNLVWNGTLNVSDSGGLAVGTYPLFAYGGTFQGNPQLGTKPHRFSCLLDTTTPGLVNLVVGPTPPLTAWGYDGFAEADVSPALTNAIGVAAGSYHTLALISDGTVRAWGDDSVGQCDVPSGLSNVVLIAAGAYHNLALRADGSVAAWGDDSAGQCDVPAGATNIVAVSAGDWHSLALRADGKVFAWGDNSWGQSQVPSTATNVIALSAGGEHSLALNADGTVLGWGSSIGPNGTYAGQRDVPPGLNRVMAISGGGFHSLALKDDGTVVAWGDNSRGQCSVPPGLKALAIAAGSGQSLAIIPGGTVVAWGDNYDGQCSVPSDMDSATDISAGGSHSVAFSGSSFPAPLLANPAHPGKVFGINFQTQRGHYYFLQYKNLLKDTNWTLLKGIAGDGGVKPISDPGASLPQRFYRVRRQ